MENGDGKFIIDEEGTYRLLPRFVAERPLEVERHGHIGSRLGYALLTSHAKATKPRKDEFRDRVGTIIERTSTGKARMNAYKDRVAETERVKERKRARIERGVGDVLMEPGNKDDEQVGGSTCGRIWRLHRGRPTRREKQERHPHR